MLLDDDFPLLEEDLPLLDDDFFFESEELREELEISSSSGEFGDFSSPQARNNSENRSAGSSFVIVIDAKNCLQRRI